MAKPNIIKIILLSFAAALVIGLVVMTAVFPYIWGYA